MHLYYNEKLCATLTTTIAAYHCDSKECLMIIINHEKSPFSYILKKFSDIKMKLVLIVRKKINK